MRTTSKEFNEIFLSEISKFDSRSYAYDIFFNSDSSRFTEIARQYGIQNGSSALNYMYSVFHSWKNNRVRPNSGSMYNIIVSAASTFTIEEKFAEAYTQLAKHIKNSFPKRIKLSEVSRAFESIVISIKKYNLEKTTYYSRYIYKGSELENYQVYVQNIFLLYTKVIFDNLSDDVLLFKKVYNEINTSFIEVKFSTYLYNIEIDIREIIKGNLDFKKVFTFNHPIAEPDIVNNTLAYFSIQKLSEIVKATNTTKIDAFLTELEIEAIARKKQDIEKSNSGGSMHYTLRTNSGILNIKIRILSFTEKIVIILRIVLFIVALGWLAYYCLVVKQSFLFFVAGAFVSSFLVTPIYINILNFIKDSIKRKSHGR
jgi:hypothetical protein